MPYANEVRIMGHLGRDAETKFTQSGKSITNFSVAMNVGTKESPRTVWCDVKAWNQPDVVQTLQKGSLVQVNGRLDQESWEDKQTGKKVYKSVVVADMVSIPCWEKRESSGGDGVVSRPRSSQPKQQAAPQQAEAFQASDDDIPW